ncbi:Protein of unknown function [Arenibacter nanhaiticus]|uniref:DinB superfamily protein n=1 Tax=Arenibacter nanhaiticus TaxID=558155 RepID=A0A1M6G3X4_9FLAO|nr:DUF1572 family protein [Arenibacter nanhaiticus]SHJ04666.1 Protein of unknown function [Arenibacter nanhaiticus]
MNSYLNSVKKQFEYYKSLGEKTMDQLPDEMLFWIPTTESNSIAMIVKHLHGNMRSRWTDFLTADGEKDWRNRAAEFNNDTTAKPAAMAQWNQGWECLFNALDALKENDLERVVYIRNMGHTVIEAINRQLCHYSYHIGQIVFLGKMIQNQKWQPLSIPKEASEQYNSDKLSKGKRTQHFTDDL